MGMDVSEYEFRSSYSCSKIAWIVWDVSGEERKEDSSLICFGLRCTKDQSNSGTNLACRQNSPNLSHNRFITAQVCRSLEDETDIIPKEVARISFRVE